MNHCSGPLNLNQHVRFKMTERGVEIARKYWSIIGHFPNDAFDVGEPDVECSQQLHEVIRIFGGENMQSHFGGSPIYDIIVEPNEFDVTGSTPKVQANNDAAVG